LCKDEDDVTSFAALIETIKTTVVTYVSQIALVEQQRLAITGELTFSISANGTEPEEDDFEAREERDKQQLKGLMQCGDFTDRSTDSIKAAISTNNDAVFKGEDGCNAKKFLKLAQQQTGRCSSASLDLDAIRAVSVEIVQCSKKLSETVEEASFKLILSALTSFRVTFTTEITNVQQRLSTLTGFALSAADLEIKFVDPEGGSEPVEPKPVDFSKNGTLSKDTDPIGFLKYQWQEFRYAFSTMDIVQQSISMVLKIDEPNTIPIKSSEFFQAISTYYTLIGKGRFLRSELEEVSMKIISFFGKVNIASKSQILSLEAISGGLTGYQMACVSEFSTIQQKLSEYAAVGSLDLSFDEYVIDGDDISLEEVQIEKPEKSIQFKSDLLETTDRFQVMMTCIGAAISGDFESLPGAVLEVSSTEFLDDLNRLLINLATDLTGIDIKLFERFSTYIIETRPSDKQIEALKTTKFTVESYQIQTLLIASEVSKEIEFSMSNMLSGQNLTELYMKQKVLSKVSQSIEKASFMICSSDNSSMLMDKNKTTGSPDEYSGKPTKMESTKSPTTMEPEGETPVSMNNVSISSSLDKKPETINFDVILDLFEIGTMEFFTDFDEKEKTMMPTNEGEGLESLPDSYKLKFNTLCQIFSIHIEIVEMKIKNIKKNIFLIEEDCNPDLEEPVGMLYDGKDFCCCPESSGNAMKPVMTTSRGSMRTTMRTASRPMRSSIKSGTATMGSSKTTRMSSMSNGSKPNCKCSMKMTTKGPGMKTTQRTKPGMTKSFQLRFRKI
jgi:hypothetical protein